jgi:molybdenum cofactor biosynthesis protein B
MHFIERISGIFSHYTPHTMLGLAMTVVVIIAMVNLFKSRNDFTDFSSTIPMHDYGLGDAPIAKRMNSFAVPVSVAIINISNSGRSESGEVVEKLMRNGNRNFVVLSRQTVTMAQFEHALKECLSNNEIRAIITIGGTGISSTDAVPEVCAKYYDKHLPGFGELFRYLTNRIMNVQKHVVGFPGVDSRATAGTCGNKIIYSLPRSPQAARMGFVEIINDSTHPIIAQLDIKKD